MVISDWFISKNRMSFSFADNLKYGSKQGEGCTDCQLILTPLSEITDDQAKLMASIVGLQIEGSTIQRNSVGIMVSNGTYDLWVFFSGQLSMMKNGKPYNRDMRRLYDYCREQCIDVGYGKLISVIEAEIAVSKKEVNKMQTI